MSSGWIKKNLKV
uniref:Uncharacterized protein n=1 Tax=Arundo donax TaxID=35708 RepID=A0A0A9AYU8_ARUDO